MGARRKDIQQARWYLVVDEYVQPVDRVFFDVEEAAEECAEIAEVEEHPYSVVEVTLTRRDGILHADARVVPADLIPR